MHDKLTPLAYWRFLRQFLRGLLTWGGGSVVAGVAVALTSKSPFWRQFGWQQVAWGVIDAALALAGRGNVKTNYLLARAEVWEGDIRGEANRLWWILIINGTLDAVYIAGGAWLLRQPTAHRRGMGAGIILQGGFLLLWDFVNAVRVGRWLTDD